MRLLSRFWWLFLLPAGCTGNVVSGTLTLPAGLTFHNDVSRSDISVSVIGTSDMFSGSVADTPAEGDIATGACHYSLTVPEDAAGVWFSMTTYARPIQYAECGNQPVRTRFSSGGLGLFFPLLRATQNLPATASCP